VTLTNHVVHSVRFHWAQLFLVTFFWLWKWVFASLRLLFFHPARRLYYHTGDCFSFVTVTKHDSSVQIGGLCSFPKNPFPESLRYAWKIIFTMCFMNIITQYFHAQHWCFQCAHSFLGSYHGHRIHFSRKHCVHVIKHCHMCDLSSGSGYNFPSFW
jgi:hypothetical protein